MSAFLEPQEVVTEPQAQRGLRMLLFDGMCSQAMGVLTGGAFLVAFAMLLGASNTIIGLLAAIGPFAQILQIPGIYLVNRTRRRKLLTVLPAAGGRAMWVFIILVPWLFPKPMQGLALVVILIARAFPLHVFNVGFVGILADLVPEQKRANVFTTRNVLHAVVLSLGTFLAGQWLNLTPFPLNYQTLYFVGLLGGLVSIYYLRRLTQLEFSVRFSTRRAESITGFSARLSSIRTTVQENADFVRIIVNTFLHNVAAWALAPLYILFFVRQLGASDAWLGLMNTVASAAAIFGWLFWRRVFLRWGARRTLTLTVSLLGIYPVIAGLSGNLTIILLGAAFNGLVSPGVSLSHTNTLLKVFPAGQRATYMGVYTTLMNAGAFIFPWIGVALGRHFGLAPTLVGMGFLWIVLSTGFRIWPLRVPDTITSGTPTADKPRA